MNEAFMPLILVPDRPFGRFPEKFVPKRRSELSLPVALPRQAVTQPGQAGTHGAPAKTRSGFVGNP